MTVMKAQTLTKTTSRLPRYYRFCRPLLVSGVLFVFLGATRLHAGDTTAVASQSALLPDLWHNLTSVGLSPLTLATVSALSLVPEMAEHETTRPFQRWIDHPSADHFFEAGDILGKGSLHLGLGLSGYALGKLTHREGVARFGSDLTSAIFIAGGIATGMKLALNRTRPDGANYSFPSGHATMAFTTAAVISARSPLLVSLAAQSAATFVALSRLQENRHYISDVAAGALLGNLIGFEVSHQRHRREARRLSVQFPSRSIRLSLALD